LNVRYFRQLQAINDSVAVAVWEEDTLEEALVNCLEEYSAMEKAVNARQARQRYLNGLFNGGDEEEDEPTCVLCKCEFQKGVMLGCMSSAIPTAFPLTF
jgi:E3 ubiquitin-protein ligase SHPRH